MAKGKGDEANFRINVDGNAAEASKDIATSARLAAKSIEAFEAEAKALGADLRRLKGNSDEVKKAKEGLREKINAAKESVSLLTVELQKQGVSYAAAAKAAKSYGADVREGLKDAVSKLSGARADFAKAFERIVPQSIRDRVAKVIAPSMKAMAERMAAAKTVLSAGMARAFGPTTQAVGRALESLKAAVGRSFLAPLASGLGKAIAALGGALKPILASALPALGSGLKALGGLALGAGAAIAAVAAAAVAGVGALVAFGLAAADAAGKMQRQRQALWDTAENAKNLGTQVTALAGKVPQGTEELNGLALALSKTRLSGRAVVDTMNAVAQVSGAVDATAGNKIQELITRGHQFGRMAIGRLELQGTGLDFDEVAREYAAGTKKSIAAARNELRMGIAPIDAGAEALRKAAEKKFGALNIENAFSLENAPKKFGEAFKALMGDIDLKPITNGLRDAFAQLNPDAPLGRAVHSFMTTLGSGFAEVVGKLIPSMVEGFKWLVVGALKVGTAFYEMKKRVKEAFGEGDWLELGKAIMVGLVKGMLAGQAAVWKAIQETAGGIKKAFTGEMEIHSPSKVFDRYGERTTDGYAQGVERGAARANGAVRDMVQLPALPAAPERALPSAGSVPVIVNLYGIKDAEQLQSGSFFSDLAVAVRSARQGAAA